MLFCQKRVYQLTMFAVTSFESKSALALVIGISRDTPTIVLTRRGITRWVVKYCS